MKKILSLALAAVMLLSIIPTAFAAENNWQGGTKVEYTATANEQYTVTVPATLAPGAAGDVVASGTWGSNRKLTVTADDDVTLTNSINAADQKVLDVTFAGIELTGSNTESVSDTKQVAVANITDAIFGTWSGTFNYNVAMSDVAGGTETPTPEQPSDPDTATISFTISGVDFQADKGMTWAAWIESDYNTLPEVYGIELRTKTTNDYITASTDNGNVSLFYTAADKYGYNYDDVLKTHTIETGENYVLKYVVDHTEHQLTPITPDTGDDEATTINFTISGVDFQAEEGMTWAEWCDSEYNTYQFYCNNDYEVINSAGSKVALDGTPVNSTDTIIEGSVYGASASSFD